jgi:hypothetical protein
VIYAVSSACFLYETVNPCARDAATHVQRGLLDGIWEASTINGQAASNFLLPSGDRFADGRIAFTTTRANGPGCDELQSSGGTAIANYRVRDGGGNLQPTRQTTGRFAYDHVTKKVTLTAVNTSVEGTVSGSNLSAQGLHSIFGSLTVVLVRQASQ